ncbi:MAG: DUF433 domain-containing protein [Bacteroidota bacterium]
MLANIVTISPHVQSGTPVFAETRVPIKNLLDYLKAGDSVDDFLDHFPSVKRSQVVGLLSYFEYFFAFTTPTHEDSIT